MPQYIQVGNDVIEFPDGMSESDIAAALSGGSQQVPAEIKQPAKRTVVEDLGRQVGLTARGAIAGALSPLTAASDALVGLYNKGTGSNLPPTSTALQSLMTKTGLPEPETRLERGVQAGVEAMSGQAGLTKAAQSLGATASPLLRNQVQQITASGAAGLASQPTAEYVQEITGSPVASFVAALATGMAAGKAAGKVTDKVMKTPPPPVSIEDIKARAQRAYTSVEDMDVKAKPMSVQNMLNKTEQDLSAANFNPQLADHRPIATLMDSFRTMVGDVRVPFTKLEQMRSAALSMSRESGDAATRRLAGIVVGGIDDYLGNLKPSDLMPGSNRGSEAVAAVRNARQDWRLQARAQVIEDILDTTAIKAENPRASEADLIRQNLISLAANKNKMRMFSSQEQAAIREAVRAKGSDLLLNLLAKFNPERAGGLGSYALVGGAGSMVASGGPTVPGMLAVGTAGAGYGADKLQGLLKRREAQSLATNILTGNLDLPVDYRVPSLFGVTQANTEKR